MQKAAVSPRPAMLSSMSMQVHLQVLHTYVVVF